MGRQTDRVRDEHLVGHYEDLSPWPFIIGFAIFGLVLVVLAFCGVFGK